jgi:DNA polymerase-3 subunit alpha (Gram-positive type)
MRLLFFDVESTGLDPERHSLIEIGMVFYDNGADLRTFDCTFGSPGPVSLGALKVNRRSTASLSCENDNINTSKLVEFLLSLPSDKGDPILFAGHNVSFDVAMLKRHLLNNGFENLGELFSHRVIDTATVGEFLRQAGVISMASMSLTNLAKSLGLPTDSKQLHGAVYDANLTLDVYFAMLNKIKGLNNV